MSRKIEKITLDLDEVKLKKRLEQYKEKAIELGASNAKVISTDEIPVDERVTLKCQVPRCFGYGVCAHCPPNTLKPAELRDYLENYKWAIFFIIDFPPEVLVRDKATIKERIAAYEKVYKIVSNVESAAFFDGYYLAFGFAAGSCRHVFCSLEKNCIAMEGQRCRFSLRARPSMEAVGIDVYKMVAQAGWDIYPMATNMEASEVPKGTLAGLVIVN
ncbi:MAG: DUF2284 domain-containing protein [Candidatus Thorarchaeota archaeon]